MIVSFKSKALERFWERGDERGLRADWVAKVALVLDTMDAAESPRDMDLPGFFFHRLKGDRSETFSVRVSRNWRITCAWDGEDAVEVDLEDYHG